MQEYKKLTDELGGHLAQHKRDSEGSGIDQSFISGLGGCMHAIVTQ